MEERGGDSEDADAHEGTGVAKETGVVALAVENEVDLLQVSLEVDFCDWDA
jgi:hypothetical protein